MSAELSFELKQAIAAARAGDMDQARIMADKAIQADPQNENVLYLLSALVESEDERDSYLSRLLIVNPDHIGAQRYSDEFAQTIDDEVAEPEYEPEPDDEEIDESESDTEPIAAVAAAAAGAAQIDESWLTLDEEEIELEGPEVEEIPDWLTDEELDMDEEDFSEIVSVAEVEEDQEIPDWLSDEPADLSVEEEPELEAGFEQEALDIQPEPVAAPKKPSQKGPSNRALTIILIFLLVVAVAIVGGIAYLMFTQFLVQ